MALPSSGAISFGSIAGEMGLSAANSLSYLSSYAGNSTGYVPGGLTSSPYAMGEFFGFGFLSMSFNAYCFATDLYGGTTTLYLGSDGYYYYGASTGSGRVNGAYYQSMGYSWEYGQNEYQYLYFSDGTAYNYGSYYSWNSSGCLEMAPI
jgi:hypothetical protein